MNGDALIDAVAWALAATAIPAIVFGMLLLAIGWTQPTWWRIGCVFVGLVFVGGGSLVRSASQGPPSPSPGPAPGPQPIVPVGQFGERVRASFTGPKAEGQIIGSLFDGLGNAIDHDGNIDANLDGKLDPAVFKNNWQLGFGLSHIQKAQVGNVTPWAEKYPAFEAVVFDEVGRRGVNVTTTAPLDPTAKSQFAALCHEVGAAFAE